MNPDLPDSRPLPVLGELTELSCPRCAAHRVMEVYRHLSERVLFCLHCEHSWTLGDDEDTGSPYAR